MGKKINESQRRRPLSGALSHNTLYTAAWTKLGHVTLNNDGTVRLHVLHYTQCTAACLDEIRARNFE